MSFRLRIGRWVEYEFLTYRWDFRVCCWSSAIFILLVGTCIVLYCIYTFIQRFLQCTPIRSASSVKDPERREQSWENENRHLAHQLSMLRESEGFPIWLQRSDAQSSCWLISKDRSAGWKEIVEESTFNYLKSTSQNFTGTEALIALILFVKTNSYLVIFIVKW